ncbi:CD209 antigen-like protein C [Megalobrama amblycephala]|uniref:CD209 antigen-like protein C n=1 Tax=Megalobrama amblycephala TaxID=75352 RepID=UPI0020141A31|nr:CD209 antigen-like protein C [Megalobrama amblycephala]
MSGLVNEGMDKGSMMESEDRIQKTVDIYISAEAVRDMKHKKDMDDFNTSKTQTLQHTESDSVRIRSSRAALVCLGLLRVLLLTAVIVLCVYIHTKSTNYTEERDQLLTNITSLTKERGQLITKITNLTDVRDQLIIQNGNLTKERDQLKSEKNKQICFGKVDGWTNYQNSAYFISSEKKNWTESRKYCSVRGADLIIINNKEEQNFVRNITSSESVWIGLTDRDVEGTWKWVDGTNMNSGFRFWGSGEPNGNGNKDCALIYSSGWADFPCNFNYKWICEKTIFK